MLKPETVAGQLFSSSSVPETSRMTNVPKKIRTAKFLRLHHMTPTTPPVRNKPIKNTSESP